MSLHDANILIVDDDPAIGEMVGSYLTENDFCCTAVKTGAEMTTALQQQSFQLVLLDLRLSRENGLDLARKLRETSEIPVIILTGKRDEADRVMGLELAADDYVVKPFSLRELLARIRAVLRRYQNTSKPERPTTPVVDLRGYRFDGWELILGTRRLVAPDGKPVELSNGEFSLLQAFCTAQGRVLSREQLLDATRLHGGEVYDRSIDVQILRVRRKIESTPSVPRYIKTERGAGYRFVPPVEPLQ